MPQQWGQVDGVRSTLYCCGMNWQVKMSFSLKKWIWYNQSINQSLSTIGLVAVKPMKLLSSSLKKKLLVSHSLFGFIHLISCHVNHSSKFKALKSMQTIGLVVMQMIVQNNESPNWFTANDC